MARQRKKNIISKDIVETIEEVDEKTAIEKPSNNLKEETKELEIKKETKELEPAEVIKEIIENDPIIDLKTKNTYVATFDIRVTDSLYGNRRLKNSMDTISLVTKENGYKFISKVYDVNHIHNEKHEMPSLYNCYRKIFVDDLISRLNTGDYLIVVNCKTSLTAGNNIRFTLPTSIKESDISKKVINNVPYFITRK